MIGGAAQIVWTVRPSLHLNVQTTTTTCCPGFTSEHDENNDRHGRRTHFLSLPPSFEDSLKAATTKGKRDRFATDSPLSNIIGRRRQNHPRGIARAMAAVMSRQTCLNDLGVHGCHLTLTSLCVARGQKSHPTIHLNIGYPHDPS
jgi:hypothetical protein